MIKMTNQLFYDSPIIHWFHVFRVLEIKRDHRRVLNAEPRRIEVYKFVEEAWPFGIVKHVAPEIKILNDFKVLSN